MIEVATTGLAFPEGPVVLPDGRLAFCEECAGRISVYDGKGTSALAYTGGSPNGAALGSDGNLYIAQNGGIVGAWRASSMLSPSIQRFSKAGRIQELCKTGPGKPLLAPNDICFGPDGRLYFTDPAHAYDPNHRSQPGCLYSLGTRGPAELVIELDPVYPNGIGFLPDGTLIWVESYERHICMMRGQRRIVLAQLPEGHIPDGFAVAADGRIFAATLFSHGITIVSPEGQYLGFLDLGPTSYPTNCAFQGRRLWVTDAGDFSVDFLHGRLLSMETDAEGMPMHAGVIE